MVGGSRIFLEVFGKGPTVSYRAENLATTPRSPRPQPNQYTC